MENKNVRHITFFKFKPEVTEEEKLEYEKDTKEMLRFFSDVAKNVHFEKNLAKSEYEYIINAEFENLGTRANYLSHDVHVNFFNKWNEKWESRVSGVIPI
jgi:hypothetical protein